MHIYTLIVDVKKRSRTKPKNRCDQVATPSLVWELWQPGQECKMRVRSQPAGANADASARRKPQGGQKAVQWFDYVHPEPRGRARCLRVPDTTKPRPPTSSPPVHIQLIRNTGPNSTPKYPAASFCAQALPSLPPNLCLMCIELGFLNLGVSAYFHRVVLQIQHNAAGCRRDATQPPVSASTSNLEYPALDAGSARSCNAQNQPASPCARILDTRISVSKAHFLTRNVTNGATLAKWQRKNEVSKARHGSDPSRTGGGVCGIFRALLLNADASQTLPSLLHALSPSIVQI
ncbi:hypothetical protein C8R47DRAFT_1081885 [Mycena vitilis]|nr:hypothetical protein C8R47DRAFT_1081885 [Mycena vitilis]